MVVAALVVHLLPNTVEDTVKELSRWGSLLLGELQGHLLPVVAESADAQEGERLFEELRCTEGVQFVDVVMVDFSEGANELWNEEIFLKQML